MLSGDDVFTMQFARRAPEHDHVPANLGEILGKIKGIGHRTVTMRPHPPPCDYAPEDLAEAVSECSVAYRGYDYPHPGGGQYGAARTTDGYVEACHDAFGHMSIWKFDCSGQFTEYAALMEDIIVDDRPGTAPRPRHLEPIWRLYDISEVFAFASNLATRTGKRYAISVAFDGMGDRVLDIRTAGRIGFYNKYKSVQDRIELDPAVVDPIHGIALHGSIALEKTLEVMDRFGWSGDGPRGVLEYDQELFYDKTRQA